MHNPGRTIAEITGEANNFVFGAAVAIHAGMQEYHHVQDMAAAQHVVNAVARREQAAVAEANALRHQVSVLLAALEESDQENLRLTMRIANSARH